MNDTNHRIRGKINITTKNETIMSAPKATPTYRIYRGASPVEISRAKAAKLIRDQRVKARRDPSWYSVYFDIDSGIKTICLYEAYDNSSSISINRAKSRS